MPLALLALFVGYLLINAGIRNEHPWAAIVQAFGGSPPGPPGIAPGEPGSITPPGQGINPATGGVSGEYGPRAPTKALARILGVATKLPGISASGICANPTAGGHISGSEHYDCNATDLGGSQSSLAAAFAILLAAAKSRAIPVHCIIWDRHIYQRPSFSRRSYSGASTHETHIHISGWPSVGGEC